MMRKVSAEFFGLSEKDMKRIKGRKYPVSMKNFCGFSGMGSFCPNKEKTAAKIFNQR